MKKNQTPKTIDDYLAKQSPKVKAILKQLRDLIKTAVPGSKESISYGMPAWKLDGKPLVYFAAHAGHIGFYPTPRPIAVFRDELSKYKHSKGAIQFPNDQPIPRDLVKKIVRFRKKEIESTTKKK